MTETDRRQSASKIRANAGRCIKLGPGGAGQETHFNTNRNVPGDGPVAHARAAADDCEAVDAALRAGPAPDRDCLGTTCSAGLIGWGRAARGDAPLDRASEAAGWHDGGVRRSWRAKRLAARRLLQQTISTKLTKGASVRLDPAARSVEAGRVLAEGFAGPGLVNRPLECAI